MITEPPSSTGATPAPAGPRGAARHIFRIGFALPEVADGLGVAVPTLRGWIRAGRLAVVGTERRRVVRPSALADAFGPDVARAMLDRAAAEGAPVLDDTTTPTGPAPPGE